MDETDLKGSKSSQLQHAQSAACGFSKWRQLQNSPNTRKISDVEFSPEETELQKDSWLTYTFTFF
jgi:hypothetical protein